MLAACPIATFCRLPDCNASCFADWGRSCDLRFSEQIKLGEAAFGKRKAKAFQTFLVWGQAGQSSKERQLGVRAAWGQAGQGQRMTILAWIELGALASMEAGVLGILAWINVADGVLKIMGP